MAANTALIPVQSSGWRMGFANLLRKEFSLWWGTHRWWRQALLWLLITNGLVAMVQVGVSQQGLPEGSTLLGMLTEVFFGISAMALPIGATLALQDAIIGERQSGTAEWILSKPISRQAFVLAKLLGHGLSFLALGVLVPCLAAYGQITAWAGEAPALLPFLTAMALQVLNVLFYVALALMLGTIFTVRGAVAGSAIGFVLAGMVVPNFAPELIRFTPWKIVDMGVLWVTRGVLPPDLAMPVSFSLVLLVAFVIVALVRFEREEL